MTSVAKSGMNLFAQASFEALKVKGAAIAKQKAASIELCARDVFHNTCASTQHSLARAGNGIQVIKERGPALFTPAFEKMSTMISKAKGYTQVANDESQFEAKEAKLEAAEAVFEEVAAAKVASFSEKGFLSSLALEAANKVPMNRFSLGFMPKLPAYMAIPKIEVGLPQFPITGLKLPAMNEDTIAHAAGVAIELGAGAVELSHDVKLASVDAFNVAKEAKTTLCSTLTSAHDALPEALRSKLPSLIERAKDRALDEAASASTGSLRQAFEERHQAEVEAIRSGASTALRAVLGDDTDRMVNAGEVIARHYTEQARESLNSNINRTFEYLRSILRAIYSAIISLVTRSSV